MSTLASTQPPSLRSILLDQARQANPRLGQERNVAEAILARRETQRMLGTDQLLRPDAVLSEVPTRLTPEETQDETALADRPAETPPQVTVSTPDGPQIQFLTGTQLDRLI